MDKWAEWLISRRYGGNKQEFGKVIVELQRLRDQVIKNASLKQGDLVLDIGTGDGLLGFEAMKFIAPEGHVYLSDISSDALEFCAEIVGDLGVSNQTTLVVIDVSEAFPPLLPLMDTIVSRAVLLYVRDKQKAFENLYRQLKPGGRLSISEPINRFSSLEGKGIEAIFGVDMPELGQLAARIAKLFGHPPDFTSDTMQNFDERDLLRMAQDAGFVEVEIQYRARVKRDARAAPLSTCMDFAPNPNAPTMRETLSQLSSEESSQFLDLLDSKLQGSGVLREADCFLVARKP